jgi:NitT/TauT family transport system ATP-binding protein
LNIGHSNGTAAPADGDGDMIGIDVLSVEALHHAYAQGEIAIADLSFTVEAGEIVGPSGCGKTTLLKALAGLVAPTGGDIRFQGKPVRGVPPGLAMVFHEYGRSVFA